MAEQNSSENFEDEPSRHRRERRELQATIQQLKKSVNKNDKARKKKVDGEIKALEEAFGKRWQHFDENATTESNNTPIPNQSDDNSPSAQAVPVENEEKQHVSRKARRLANKEKRQAEADANLEVIDYDNQPDLIRCRNESSLIDEQLSKLGLELRSIPSDGNCLFASIVDQTSGLSVRQLRETVAKYLREHREEYEPFIDTDYDVYCDKLSKENVWGGQIELQVCATILERPIEVIQGGGNEPIRINHSSSKSPIIITYHRYLYANGEHYNMLAILVLFIAVVCFKYFNDSQELVHQDIGQCDMNEAQKIIDNLCELYSLGQVTGSQCSALCNANSTITLAQCLSLSSSKIVLLMSTNESSYVVLKSSRRYFDRENTDILFNEPIVSIPSSLFRFYDIINSTLTTHMGNALTNLTHEKLIRRLFRHDRIENSVILLENFDDVVVKYNDYYEQNLALSLTTELNTLYSLMTQHEFLLSHYYRSKHELMPKILGWCGHTYLTEHLTPLNHPQIEEQLEADTWIPKAWLANRLLQLVDSFEQELHAPLHLCDLQLSNFGVSAGGNIKLLDLDMAYFNGLIPLYPPEKCRRHSDCSFFDCSGYCDKRTRRCHTNRRINNNLQVLCEKVLVKLLKPETIPSRLHDVLLSYVHKCASPPGRYKRARDLKIEASSRLLRIMQVMLDGELRSANITSSLF
ncbi:unnamed protein product [Adineta ricciae]|uniref:OTU domain-containing protein n=1 Tax=Adineta ricciae TaxID=249248 RepID=A0A813QEJ8_ADIRI|nr:unnamed protein product [Adineta ricciae]